jgi:hypothetical protein
MTFGRELVVLLTKLSMFGKFLVHAWRFENRTFYISSWRIKLILAPLFLAPSQSGILKWVWPSMNQYRMFFVQTSTLPPRMYQRLTKYGRFCKQNNQLLTKSHNELKDNSISSVVMISTLGILQNDVLVKTPVGLCINVGCVRIGETYRLQTIQI